MMRIVITGNTRMRERYVCISAYDIDSKCYIRPQPTGRIHFNEDEIVALKAFPFNLMDCQYEFSANFKPHIEDCHVSQMQYKRTLRNEQITKFLKWISNDSLLDIFGIKPDDEEKRFFYKNNVPERSLGTIICNGFPTLSFSENRYESGKHKIRLQFQDQTDVVVQNVPIVDLRLLNYLREQLCGSSHSSVERAFNQLLRESKEIFIRLGLSRLFFPTGKEPGYWLQVTGLFPIPDYLGYYSFHRPN